MVSSVLVVLVVDVVEIERQIEKVRLRVKTGRECNGGSVHGGEQAIAGLLRRRA